MFIFLDDERTPPDGWILVRWPEEVISLLKKGPVEKISLDHDLGDDDHGTGYDVIKWIEEAVVVDKFVPPEIYVHSANPAAKTRMLNGIDAINRHHENNLKRRLSPSL